MVFLFQNTWRRCVSYRALETVSSVRGRRGPSVALRPDVVTEYRRGRGTLLNQVWTEDETALPRSLTEKYVRHSESVCNH